MASLKLRPVLRGVIASGLVVAGIAMASTSPAVADPQLPNSASQAEQQLAELGHQAEIVNEQLLGAQVDLDAKRAQQAESEAQLATANAALRDAQTKQEQFRGTVDSLTAATYQGARLNRLSALMISRSPQDLLDQMSGLDVLATDTTQRVNNFAAASSQAAKAEADARSATATAKEASDAATALQVDLQRKQGDLTTQSAAVRAKYNSLTQAERINFAGTTTPAGYVAPVAMPTRSVPAATGSSATGPSATGPSATGSSATGSSATGSSATGSSATGSSATGSSQAVAPAQASGSSSGAGALQAALSKLGSPYVYGATGPNAFDCSGLTQWAYKQVGISIPRTAGAQASGGTPVSRDQLQPGDLVFFYSPISHVGMYAGNGNVVHASTEGQPVKVAPMQYMPFSGARRY